MPDNTAIAITIVLMIALLAAVVYLCKWIASPQTRADYKVMVRCAEGHLFTTVWIAGISIKAIRLGRQRFQYCPVGEHWALVRPVDPLDLNRAERRFAADHHDRPIP